ncbi:telomere-associated protein Tap [Streptomyces silvisoli]|uniref:Transcriptional regulator n=1 Tax=Streptomyces silvisoli TaxID=3034235 RepID=A0ABT5ZU52_9ACTN|nr:transcriptional regulator [Streptomyces silvisoli]MDF3293049.1 transcriptional regulator [Streptomyces silvisoli]
MASQEELFAAVDALLEGEPQLPPPEERKRLREAAGVTQARLAQVLQTTTQTVKNWDTGRSEPRPPRRQAYLRLLEGWAAKYPNTTPDASPASPPEPEPVPRTSTTNTPRRPADVPQQTTPAPPAVSPPSAGARRVVSAKQASTSHRPAAKKVAQPALDQRFPHGPLGVLGGDGMVYCPGGVVLDCPATTIAQLVEWTLQDSGIGAARLNRNGKDADPLVVLTASAAVKLGLPERLEGPEARRSLRLPEDHPVVRQIARAKWKLTQRGFGPWPRIYRPAKGSERQCVQLAILSWDALDARAWGEAADLHPAELARVLGEFAIRVITPRGSTAVCGLELMTALRPPTRAAKDASGAWVSAPNPGALTAVVDPAPPEAPAEHPVAQGWTGGFLDEEAYQWVRDVDLLSDQECLLPFAVGIDINTAFLAAAARLTVGLGSPVHVDRPSFDKKVPGSWYVDLSHVELDPRLPSPFTSTGERPSGPAWYQTNTVAYAQELGYEVTPVEAFLRYETGAYLDPWHDRLRAAYVATMGDLGVPVGGDVGERAFLEAMEQHKQTDPGLVCVLSAIKSTVKGGIGKLRERPQGRHYRDGERWPALERPTWRPDIRAAVIAKARVNMHRKMLNVAKATGRYPLAVLSDCVVYPSPGPSPLDFLPLTEDGRILPGTFRLGASPGMAKLEGVQEMAWAVDLMEQGYNPARHIKGGDAVMDAGE